MGKKRRKNERKYSEKNRSKGRINTSLVFLAMLICLLAGQTTSFAATVALSWDANTESDLAGYKVYYQADSSTLPFNGSGALEGALLLDTKIRPAPPSAALTRTIHTSLQ